MSTSRVPQLPLPRIVIWLTPKRPLLWILLLTFVIGIVLCSVSVFIIGVVKQHPAIPSALMISPTLTTTARRETKANTLTMLTITRSPKSTLTPRAAMTSTVDVWKNCNAGYISRLKVGDKAYVSNDPPLRNRLRSGPYINESITGYIDPGEQVEILKGPSCSNQWVWWKIKSLKNGEIGWTSEGDLNNYWLVPVK